MNKNHQKSSFQSCVRCGPSSLIVPVPALRAPRSPSDLFSTWGDCNTRLVSHYDFLCQNLHSIFPTSPSQSYPSYSYPNPWFSCHPNEPNHCVSSGRIETAISSEAAVFSVHVSSCFWDLQNGRLMRPSSSWTSISTASLVRYLGKSWLYSWYIRKMTSQPPPPRKILEFDFFLGGGVYVVIFRFNSCFVAA